MSKIPASISDTLLHHKDTDQTEKVILPITRYNNVLNAPKVVSSVTSVKGAPFVLFISDSEELSTEELRKLTGTVG